MNHAKVIMNEGVLSAIGNTPLVNLDKLSRNYHFSLFAKLEGLNPGGSMKDRAAMCMVRRGMETGEIGIGTVVIESSSGNMGIGLAQVCAYFGLRFICVVDPKTTAQNIRILESLGAEIEMVREPDSITGEFLQARIHRVGRLLKVVNNSFWPNQYANLANAAAHRETMREITTDLEVPVDFLFCATSTCGTLRGCAEYIRDHGLFTTIIAVDAVGSVIFGGQCCKRLIPGHGAAVTPELFRTGLAHRCIHVSDLDCVVGCRRLARQEAILAGGSSGGIIVSVERAQPLIPRGANCVAILPDRGERYLDTIYSDAWVVEHFGEMSHLWDEVTPAEVLLKGSA